MLERRLERERESYRETVRERGVARGLEKQTVRRIRLEGERVRQKQPSRAVLSKKSSKNMQQIYRRTTIPKCDSDDQSMELGVTTHRSLLKHPRLSK